MPFKPGQSGNPTGRKAGTPNKATADVRGAIALIAQRNVRAAEEWLAEVEDPARRLELFLRMIEYHIPKLSAVKVDLGQMSVEDILRELERRASTRPDPGQGSDPGSGSGA